MRGSGVLLHITSLPSRGPIGDLGPAARDFVDWLASAGQTRWQWLPLNPVGPGNSPYASPSAFAVEPALLSLEDLVDDGLLDASDLPAARYPNSTVDWEAVWREKEPLLRKAARAHGRSEPIPEWLEAWGAFAGDDAVALQLLCDRQLRGLRAHAESRGVQLIGDVPIFVSGDGCDARAKPGIFDFDKRAGVPPDYFSPTGQLWGNPHYDWDSEAVYNWWRARFERVLEHVHRVRIDHFRGFAAAWAVPLSAETAMIGEWIDGPGMKLFSRLGLDARKQLIAEDLGLITPEVEELRDALGAPGMKVLQFAFGSEKMRHAFLPHDFETTNCVAYTGTHDNDTASGWYESAPEEVRHRFRVCTRSSGEAWELVRLAWSSIASDAIAPMQDLLGLGNEARMNVPGTCEGNWGWRLSEPPSAALAERLRELTWVTGRLSSTP
ncbi:MAG TPA: 4-alpha-glucanotransferase [Myxococcota bacterium]|nr:4-alpha-glucanotransferase [Myxococcota bacterium]